MQEGFEAVILRRSASRRSFVLGGGECYLQKSTEINFANKMLFIIIKEEK